VSVALAQRDAERHCAERARREAANFYWGFLALPREQRMAIYALYDFARDVDDAADLQLSGLDRHRIRLGACEKGVYVDEVMAVLGRAAVRHAIPWTELHELIRGVELDLTVARYQTWDDLSRYCHLVASVVGRMCVRIFGFDDDAALTHADELGLGLQLINILRDVREDACRGRLYIPLADLARFSLSPTEVLAGEPGPGWEALVAFEAARARTLLGAGLRVTRHIPRRARACVRTMAGIYSSVLDRIEHEPRLPLVARASVPPAAKAWITARSWARVA
jgi:15-cis-phytoene synthase